MKKLLPFLPIAGFLAYLSLGSNSSGFPSVPGVSSTTTACASCHGPNSTNTQLAISGIPASGWVAGNTYLLTCSVTNSARVAGGFDITVPGINGGTISNPSTGTTLNGATGIHHTSPKSFTGGTATWTFSWTAPTSAAATAVTFNMAGNAVNLNGNETGDVPNRVQITFNKAAAPPAAPTVTASGPTSICAGGTFPTLTASSSGATAYTWFSGATQVATGATFTPTAAGTYTATATNTTGTSSASTPVTITVNPNPVLTVTQSDATPCPGQCDTITISSSIASTSYSFTPPGGSSTPVTGNTFVVCVPGPPNNPTSPLVVNITGTVAGTSCQGSSPLTISPLLPPPATFTYTNTGLTYNFTGPAGTGLTYQWNLGNSQSSSLQNPTVTYAAPGTYTVTLLVTNTQTGCINATQQTVQVSASVAALVGLEGFRFGPNPAGRTLTLHTGKLKADVRLKDLSGKTVAMLRSRNETSAEKIVSIAHLSAGLYLIEVETDNARTVEKLVVR